MTVPRSGATNRGKNAERASGEARGSGAGAGGGGGPEEYDSDPQGGGGSMDMETETHRPDTGGAAPIGGSR